METPPCAWKKIAVKSLCETARAKSKTALLRDKKSDTLELEMLLLRMKDRYLIEMPTRTLAASSPSEADRAGSPGFQMMLPLPMLQLIKG